MDMSSFDLLEKKIRQAVNSIEELKKKSSPDGSVVLTKSQVERISVKLSEISEWIDHARIQKR